MYFNKHISMDGWKGAFLKHWLHHEAHLEAFGSHGSWSGGDFDNRQLLGDFGL